MSVEVFLLFEDGHNVDLSRKKIFLIYIISKNSIKSHHIVRFIIFVLVIAVVLNEVICIQRLITVIYFYIVPYLFKSLR